MRQSYKSQVSTPKIEAPILEEFRVTNAIVDKGVASLAVFI